MMGATLVMGFFIGIFCGFMVSRGFVFWLDRILPFIQKDIEEVRVENMRLRFENDCLREELDDVDYVTEYTEEVTE